MPYKHVPLFPKAKDAYPCVLARVYCTASSRPKFVKVVTQDNGARRFAFVQGVIDGPIQPHIHTTEIKIIDRNQTHQFYMFYKNHRHLPKNQTVSAMSPNTFWNGDILIMRGAAQSNGVVNMRQNDKQLADFALKRCVHLIRQGRRVRVPKNLIFTKRH